MNIYLGNILFDQVYDHMGYELTESDREIWNKYHSDKADLSDKPSCFHVFDMPKCIHFKGENAKEAILKMFTRDKLKSPKGRFQVQEVK